MRLASLTLLLSLGLSGCASPTSVATPLDTLLDTIERRLALADGVALLKWDQNLPVQDAPREQQILLRVREAATDYALDPLRAAGFFSDQMEAGKLVQFALLNRWERQSQAPDTPRLDLKTALRPQLDALQHQLLDGLQHFDRHRPVDCALAVATAVAERSRDALHELALQRAAGRLCDLS
ncbi:chorismate mutase [Pseudomonas sp. RP23018S]|uniref:chorismate mutase n=1 Tax=Pseudomonas sp. RP23018S TaxID=3096037 RepID=UPI002ACA8292|nr:chorismate mutase [Pseudomonas sp. RP23018S]MDZ5604128.1 chorismate mutase [Pseudomonas sp. RP23018S]